MENDQDVVMKVSSRKVDELKQEPQTETKPSYNPSVSYKWNPNDAIPMSGLEFANVLNAVRTILATPEAQRIMLIEKANINIENTLSRMVEMGIVVEQEKNK